MAQHRHTTAGIGILESVPYPPKPDWWRNQLGNGSGECGKCRAWWTGANTSHCGSCHANFTGLSSFDAHRAGSHAAGTRHCVDPVTVGLVDAGRAYPCWGLPGDGERWWETGE